MRTHTTRVCLAAGSVTLAAGGGAFRAWLDRSDRELPPLLLVDGETRPTLTMSLAKWRSIAGLTGDEDEARTRVLLTSPTPGARTLTFSFSAGGMLTDSVMQRITFVRPPLRLDITRDGSIDDGDAAAWHDGRTFYYWMNDSTKSTNFRKMNFPPCPPRTDLVYYSPFSRLARVVKLADTHA